MNEIKDLTKEKLEEINGGSVPTPPGRTMYCPLCNTTHDGIVWLPKSKMINRMLYRLHYCPKQNKYMAISDISGAPFYDLGQVGWPRS